MLMLYFSCPSNRKINSSTGFFWYFYHSGVQERTSPFPPPNEASFNVTENPYIAYGLDYVTKVSISLTLLCIKEKRHAVILLNKILFLKFKV